MLKNIECRQIIGRFAYGVLFFISFIYAQSPDTLWCRTYGGAGTTEWANCLHVTPDSGYIAAGRIDGFLDWDIFVVKTDSAGDTPGPKYTVVIQSILFFRLT